MLFKRTKRSRSGFLLPLIAAGLLVAGSAATVVVVQKENTAFWQPKTQALQDLNTIKTAIVAYQREHHRLPCPSPRNSAGNVGIEFSNCQTGASGAAMAIARVASGSEFVYIGALPYKTLKLGATAGEDNWGNRFTYAVIQRATDPYEFSATHGNLLVQGDGGAGVVTNSAVFVVVSHGTDGKGAYTGKSGLLGKSCTATAGEDRENCNDDAIFRRADFDTAPGNNYFDDMIAWDNIDSYAKTINNPCNRAVIGDATWDSGQCVNNSWTNVLHGVTLSPNPINNTNSATASGTASIRCDNGTLVYTSEVCNAHCVGPIGAQTWDATHNCSGTPGNTTTLNHGAPGRTVTNTASGRTGSVTITCNDGVLNQSGESCTPSGCLGTTHNWGGGCTAASSASAHGATLSLEDEDTAGGFTGALGLTCSYGSWSTGTATCYANCTGQAHNWGAACTANSTTSADGATSIINNTTANYSGSNTLLCSNGSWSSTGSSCDYTPPNCAATTLGWGAGCSANPGSSMTHGETRNGVSNTAAGYSGTANFSCNAGTMSVSGGTCSSGCSAQTVNWAPSCAGSVGALTHGANSVVSNGAPGYTGQVTVTCNNGSLSHSSASCATGGTPGCTWNVTLTGANCSGSPQAYRAAIQGTACNPGDTDMQDYSTCLASSTCVCVSNCSSQTVNWGSCTANSGATLNHGSNRSITNTTGGYSGSVTISCNNGVLNQSGASCAPSCTPCATYAGMEWDIYGSGDANASCWNYTRADCSTEIDAQPCDGVNMTPPGGMPSCGSLPASCSTQTVNWSGNCSASSGATLNSGSSRVINNTNGGFAGSTTVTCNNGVLSQSGASCAASTASCSTQTVNWAPGCSASSGAILAHGNNRSITNSAAGHTGSVTISCNNGTLSQSAVSCSATPACSAPDCAFSTLAPGGCLSHEVWRENGTYRETCCNGVLTSGPDEGPGNVGVANCNPPSNCSTQAVNWGSNCTASSGAALAHGANRTVTNTTSGYGGSVTVTCNNGTLNQSGASCAVRAPDCYQWDNPAGGSCGMYLYTDGSTEMDYEPCDGTFRTPPPGWSFCGMGGGGCSVGECNSSDVDICSVCVPNGMTYKTRSSSSSCYNWTCNNGTWTNQTPTGMCESACEIF